MARSTEGRPRHLIGRVTTAAAAVALSISLTVGSSAAEAQWGRDVTRAEAAALVDDARRDPAAFDELRQVDRIDGVPFDAAAVLGTTESERAARLDALAAVLNSDDAGSSPAEGPDRNADDRDTARDILDGDKYHDRSVPKPFRGIIAWIGDRLSGVYDAIARVLAPIVGTTGVAWVILAAFAIIVTAVTARRVAARKRSATHDPMRSSLVDLAADHRDLEAAAADAERAGDHRLAIRLLYEAGLLRLVREQRLVLRAETTARGAADQVGEPDLDRLTDRFEAIVYGGRPATADDTAEARRRWAAVLGARR